MKTRPVFSLQLQPLFFPAHLFPWDRGLEMQACGPKQPPPVFVNQISLAHGHTHSLGIVCGGLGRVEESQQRLD